MPARTAPKRSNPTTTDRKQKGGKRAAEKLAAKPKRRPAGTLVVEPIAAAPKKKAKQVKRAGAKKSAGSKISAAAAAAVATSVELARRASGAKAKLLLPFTNSSVAVRESAIHGLGLFAATKITKGALIGVAEGRRTQRNNDHVLWIEGDDGKNFGIEPLNELRFTNHSKTPNAVFYGAELFALRAIKKGEEIAFDYNGEGDPDAN